MSKDNHAELLARGHALDWFGSSRTEVWDWAMEARAALSIEASQTEDTSRSAGEASSGARRCTVCKATVAEWPMVKCCHCQEMPWEAAPDPIGGVGEREAIERALSEAEENGTDYADAILALLKSPNHSLSVPVETDMVLVPREPTEAMWEAAWEASEDYFCGDEITQRGFRLGLAAMISAAEKG